MKVLLIVATFLGLLFGLDAKAELACPAYLTPRTNSIEYTIYTYGYCIADNGILRCMSTNVHPTKVTTNPRQVYFDAGCFNRMYNGMNGTE